MWGARADVKTVTQACDPGPRLRERRPKAQRPCLGCDRRILTTCASRLCRLCRLRTADFHGGVDEMHLLETLTQRDRKDLDC